MSGSNQKFFFCLHFFKMGMWSLGIYTDWAEENGDWVKDHLKMYSFPKLQV